MEKTEMASDYYESNKGFSIRPSFLRALQKEDSERKGEQEHSPEFQKPKQKV
jgi:hypothetical protein